MPAADRSSRACVRRSTAAAGPTPSRRRAPAERMAAVGRRDPGGSAGSHPAARGRRGQDGPCDPARGAAGRAPEPSRPSLLGDGYRPGARARRPGPDQVPDRGDRGGDGIVAPRGAEPAALPPTAPPRPSRSDRAGAAGPGCASPAGSGPVGAPQRWTPPPEPRPQPARRACRSRRSARAPPPFPARPLQPNEGPRRPPLPPRPAPYGQPQPGSPNRPARAPWPEPGERGGRPAPARQWQLRRVRPPPHQARRAARPCAAPAQAPRARRAGRAGLLIESRAAPHARRRAHDRRGADCSRQGRRPAGGAQRPRHAHPPDAVPRPRPVGAAAGDRRAASGSSPPRRRRSGSTVAPGRPGRLRRPGAGPWCPAAAAAAG